MLNAIGRMVVRRKIVHLMEIALAGKIYFKSAHQLLASAVSSKCIEDSIK
jgi:hypothetical protein